MADSVVAHNIIFKATLILHQCSFCPMVCVHGQSNGQNCDAYYRTVQQLAQPTSGLHWSHHLVAHMLVTG